MRSFTVLLIFALVASLNAQSALMNFTIDFFAGYSPETPLSSECLENDFGMELESLNFSANPFQDIYMVLLAQQFEVQYLSNCGWDNVIEQFANMVSKFNENDLLSLVLDSASLEANGAALISSFESHSFNATAFGALLADVVSITNEPSFIVERFSTIFAAMNSTNTTLTNATTTTTNSTPSYIESLWENFTDFAFGLGQGLAKSTKSAKCSNATAQMTNMTFALYAQWKAALTSTANLTAFEEDLNQLSTMGTNWKTVCNIASLESDLESWITEPTEMALSLVLEMSKISTDINNLQNATTDQEIGQDVGSLIQAILGYSIN